MSRYHFRGQIFENTEFYNFFSFSVSGIPTPDLTWKHNNKPIMLNNPGYDIHYDQQTQWASLNVKEAFPKVCTQLAYYKVED